MRALDWAKSKYIWQKRLPSMIIVEAACLELVFILINIFLFAYLFLIWLTERSITCAMLLNTKMKTAMCRCIIYSQTCPRYIIITITNKRRKMKKSIYSEKETNTVNEKINKANPKIWKKRHFLTLFKSVVWAIFFQVKIKDYYRRVKITFPYSKCFSFVDQF